MLYVCTRDQDISCLSVLHCPYCGYCLTWDFSSSDCELIYTIYPLLSVFIVLKCVSCVWGDVLVCGCVCFQMWRLMVDVSCLSFMTLCLCFLRQGLCVNLKLISSALPPELWASRIHVSLCPHSSAEVTDMCHCHGLNPGSPPKPSP